MWRFGGSALPPSSSFSLFLLFYVFLCFFLFSVCVLCFFRFFGVDGFGCGGLVAVVVDLGEGSGCCGGLMMEEVVVQVVVKEDGVVEFCGCGKSLLCLFWRRKKCYFFMLWFLPCILQPLLFL